MTYYLTIWGLLGFYSRSKYFPLRLNEGFTAFIPFIGSLLLVVAVLITVKDFGLVIGLLVFLGYIMTFACLIQLIFHLPRKFQVLSMVVLHLFFISGFLY